MSLTLHFHPLSSFCQKALIALYENDTPFTKNHVDLSDPAQGAALRKLWPIAKFPVLSDEALGLTVAEASVIIEHLQQFYPGKTRFIPADPKAAIVARQLDRVFDLYVNVPLQKVVTDTFRPAGKNDTIGVEEAKALIVRAYGVVETALASRTWAAGNDFSLADCAAAPALFYARYVVPFGEHKTVAAYHDRLLARPSFARVREEAKPYFHMFPFAKAA